MADIEVLLPAMGEGIIEATITRILVNEGDLVEEDDVVVELATDKVDSELPSPQAGKVSKVLASEGDVLAVGEPILILEIIETEELLPDPTAIPFIEQIENDIVLNVEGTQPESTIDEFQYLTPLVRSIIAEEKITDQELKQVVGTGLDQRITKRDLFAYIKIRNRAPSPTAPKPKPFKKAKQQSVLPKAREKNQLEYGTEIIEMDRMRRIIADHMLDSVRTSPHVSSYVEVDMTRIVKWRNQVKDEFQEKYNEKLTLTPFFIEAAAKALRDFPMVNVSVDGYTIIKKNYINIGMATALPNGNLIVPVIKGADNMNLTGLVRSVNDLASRARKNELIPEEVQGGTFSITNVGSYGNITGTPILNQPEVAILVVGAIQKKPAVIETPDGDTIGIRNLMVMGMSFDHRAIDGALGGMYLKRVADYLENWDIDRGV